MMSAEYVNFTKMSVCNERLKIVQFALLALLIDLYSGGSNIRIIIQLNLEFVAFFCSLFGTTSLQCHLLITITGLYFSLLHGKGYKQLSVFVSLRIQCEVHVLIWWPFTSTKTHCLMRESDRYKKF